MTGNTVSHYKILEQIGQGGMGVVYKAEDTKLKRTVALKFLAPELTRDEEAKKRLLYAVRAASSLDHANICSIYEIDETDEGQVFVAMAWYDGESLKRRIERGPLKLDEAIDIATQMAAGLQAAHEKGIVHRDIKSANVIITSTGQVKIMDFGLAKIAGQTRLTMTGTTMGTVAYMSPEQARGEKVDHRTDIWSLGVVLYEMITGQLPFKGDYEQAIVYGILNETPEPITGLRTGVPMELERIVNKCMSKEQKERYQNIEELPVDLATIKANQTEQNRYSIQGLRLQGKHHNFLTRLAHWSVAAVLALALIVVIILWRSDIPNPMKVKRLFIVLQESAPLEPIGSAPFRAGQRALALSPDGSKLVYVANIDNKTQLCLHPMDSYEETDLLPGTEGAYFPFFSPDGRWVGFFADDKLKKISILGGTPTTLCDATLPYGGCWTDDDRIIFTQNEGATLSWISVNGGSPSSRGYEGLIFWPEILPDGRGILVASWPKTGIKVLDVDTGEEMQFFPGQYSNPKYLPTGHLIYEKGGKIEAIHFDVNNLRTVDSPVPILEGIRIETMNSRALQCTISKDGTLAYLSGGIQGKAELVWVNSKGEEEPLPFPADEYEQYEISPDGQRLAIQIRGEEHYDVHVLDLKDSVRNRLTRKGNNLDPIWTPDNKWVVFDSDRNGYSNLYKKPVDDIGEAIPLTNNTEMDKYYIPSSWSSNGRALAIMITSPDSISNIYLLQMDNNELQPIIVDQHSNYGPVFSPDDRWIVYMSDEQGEYDVYVTPNPPTGKKERISTINGHEPRWSPNSNELVFWTYEATALTWYVVSYNEAATPVFSKPRLLVRGDYMDVSGRGWDISPDRRLLLVKPVEKAKVFTQINIVTNWFEELKRKAPTGK